MTTETLSYNQYANQVKKTAVFHLKRLGREFILNDELRRLYRLLTLYFTANPEFEKNYLQAGSERIMFSLRKGNLVIGPPGCSKSFLFERVFRTFTEYYNPRECYRIQSANDIYSAYGQYGNGALGTLNESILFSKNYPNVYIDDLGNEPAAEANYYGTKITPLRNYLNYRHKLYLNSRLQIKTHATSNLLISSGNTDTLTLRSLYGDTVASRMYELFNIIIVNPGIDFRIDKI